MSVNVTKIRFDLADAADSLDAARDNAEHVNDKALAEKLNNATKAVQEAREYLWAKMEK